jgi:hypothetical protein
MPMVTACPWDLVLDELSRRLSQYRLAFTGACAFPGPYTPPDALGPLPAELVPRAQMIFAGQRDVEHQLRARMGALGALMHAPQAPTPTPAFFDRRA